MVANHENTKTDQESVFQDQSYSLEYGVQIKSNFMS